MQKDGVKEFYRAVCCFIVALILCMHGHMIKILNSPSITATNNPVLKQRSAFVSA
jgi:hypothetical protein